MASMVVVTMLVVFPLFLVFIFWALHTRWAGERDWVYNKHNPRRRGGGTLGLLEAIYQPSIEHVVPERASERARGSQNESGDKPEEGRPDATR